MADAGGVGWWPWPQPDAPPVPDYPLLLLPGICGTILNVRKKGEKHEGRRAWVAIEYADYAYRQLWGRYNPDTGKVESFQEDLEVIIPAPDKNGGLWPIDILDPDLYVPLHVVYYYHNFIRQFAKLGYTPSQDLFGFGYDFRQCNLSHCEELLAKLKEVSEANGGKRVDVVTHSMGGLVMKSLLALYPTEFEQLVNRWIAVATPFGGAPGFVMSSLLTGVQFTSGWQEHFFVERNSMLQMAVQSPAVHQMLPRTDFPWPITPPVTRLWLKDRATEQAVEQVHSVEDFPKFMEQVLADNTVTVDKHQIPNPMNWDCWKQAGKAQDIWASAKLPDSCKFYNLCGGGFDTPYDVIFGSQGNPLTSITEARIMFPDNTYVDGDCTVPIMCAMADGLNATDRRVLTGEGCSHRALIENPQVWDIIYSWLTGSGIPPALLVPAAPDPVLACPGGASCQCIYQKHNPPQPLPGPPRPEPQPQPSTLPDDGGTQWWHFWYWWWRRQSADDGASCSNSSAGGLTVAVCKCDLKASKHRQVSTQAPALASPPSKSILMTPLLEKCSDTSLSPVCAPQRGEFQISAVSADGTALPVVGGGSRHQAGALRQCSACGKPKVDPVHLWTEEHSSVKEGGCLGDEDEEDWVVVCSMKALGACC